jgi:hypothetical protein
VVFGGSDVDLRRYVEASFTAGLRLYGLAKPLSPDEQLHISMQGFYRFVLPGSGGPSEGYVLAGVHERTASGYGFGLAIGPQFLGAQVGGLFMLQFSVSWGLRYRNPLAESLAGRRRIPRVFMDHFYTDPILHADGCVYTDPLPGIKPFLLKCIGRPDAENPQLIHLFTGGYVPVGTHLWVDDDGTLLDQDQMHVGKIDKALVPLVQASQRMAQQLRHEEQKTGKSCAYKADLLRGVRDWGFATVLAGDGMGGAAALIATELGRTIQCGDPKTLAGSGFLPLLGRLPLKKGPMTHKGPLLGHGEAEHITPVSPVAPATVRLDDKARSHIYYGDVDPRQGKSRGWHYEPSADRSKGTYVIEETRSTPDSHGVYRANVMIEGVKKNARSSFFPKDWSPEQVEKAILEAYENRNPISHPGRCKGTTMSGIEIEMDIDVTGRISTAYPIYGGS